MNYKFPEIKTLSDVLPHVEGRSEFVVAERVFGTVVNYMVAKKDTFDMSGPDDVGGAIRRECRGIKFDLDGNIIARPFHKFFNVGEREETHPNVLDFSVDHTVYTKEDGSMAHPIMFNGTVRWCTKMGLTDVSAYMDTFCAKNPKYNQFARDCIADGYTPLFEYVGPFNKVVIEHKEENMVLLAVRNTITGEFVNINKENAKW